MQRRQVGQRRKAFQRVGGFPLQMIFNPDSAEACCQGLNATLVLRYDLLQRTPLLVGFEHETEVKFCHLCLLFNSSPSSPIIPCLTMRKIAARELLTRNRESAILKHVLNKLW